MDQRNTLTHREAWLAAMRDRLRPIFAEAGWTIPDKVRVSCGFPGSRALAKSQARLGECWGTIYSKDQHFEIFINPRIADPIEVGGVLVHELIHAAVGLDHQHKGPFRKLALKLGLEGKMTATTVGPALAAQLQLFVEAIGPYPHAEMDVLSESSGPKKQGTRMIKAACPQCDYTIRSTSKWLKLGVPVCPVDHEHGALEVEWPEGEEGELFGVVFEAEGDI